MHDLAALLERVPVVEIRGPTKREISAIHFDSRKVALGDLFVATRGTQVDSHKFIDQVIERGATAIICEVAPATLRADVTYVIVADARLALGLIAQAYFGHPSRHMRLVGVTGTNGKTTTATLLYRLFRQLGYSCGLLSTIQNYVNDEVAPSTHTTGDALQIAELLSRMVAANCSFCFMEVTSHAIDQSRIAGLEFDGAIFTNLTQDHLDYHGTMDVYARTKKRFIDRLDPSAFVLTNIDDTYGRFMVSGTAARVMTYGRAETADYAFQIRSSDFEGQSIELNGRHANFHLVGLFNAYNLVAAIGAAEQLLQSPDAAWEEARLLQPVEGRMERILASDGLAIIVDFAHTPDALEKVLETAREVAGGSEIWTVIGCGGDRDQSKRPIMAEVAARLSDRVILTSDNPRSEKIEDIIGAMLGGVPPAMRPKVEVEPDRLAAIRRACAAAPSSGLVLIAGKGHEKYQEIAGQRLPFDDAAVAKEAAAAR